MVFVGKCNFPVSACNYACHERSVEEEVEEVFTVSKSDAVGHPRTVMIHF